MNKISEILKTLHDPLHDFETVKPKKKYSEPKIYTGGVAVSKWNKLKKPEQQKAISRTVD